MRVIQILNNNVMLVDLGSHTQAIVKGKGISYKKQKGDELPTKGVENLFYLQSSESQENFAYLLRNIPLDIVTTTIEIVDKARRDYHFEVLDYIYLTLSDHLHGVYQQLRKGKYIASMVPNMHEQYPTEYRISTDALHIIQTNLHVSFPLDETKSIALHFINAKGTPVKSEITAEENSQKIQVNSIVQKILTRKGIVRNDNNKNSYDRLMVHMGYLLNRIKDKDSYSDNFARQLNSTMTKQYPKSAKISLEMVQQIETKLHVRLNENERMYFLIHIQRLSNESSNLN